MGIDIRLYKTAALTELYSQEGTFTDPIFDRSTYTWDGDLGESRDVQIWIRNDGLDDAFAITVRPVDIDGTNEATWAKVAANQGALGASIPGELYTIGNLAAGASSNFWLRVRVPAATGPELKVDLRLRSIGSWSSSSSSSSSCSSNSSVSSWSSSSSSLSSSSSSLSSSCSSSSESAGSIQTAEGGVDDPDNLASGLTKFRLKDVDADRYPNGITITKFKLEVEPAENYSVDLMNYTDPADGAPVTIVTLATVAAQEAETTTITNPSVAAGNIVYVQLPATDVDQMYVYMTFRINS